MFSALWKNIKHLPSTIPGALAAGVGGALVLLDPSTPIGQFVAQYAAVNPKVAGGLAILGGLAAVLGMGAKKVQQ